MNKRPISVTVVSLLFIVVGGGGVIKALWPLAAAGMAITRHELFDSAMVLLSGLMALVSGVFMLRAANWARWLLMVWLAFHVVIGIGHKTSTLIVHSLLMVVMSFILFLPGASAYFRRTE